MGLQKRLVAERNRSRVGERVRVVVDGPSADHELVLKARLATQAPDIDASVYLTECDPSSFRAGDFVEVEIVGAPGTTTCIAGAPVDRAIILDSEPGCRTEWACAHFFCFRRPGSGPAKAGQCRPTMAIGDVVEQVRAIASRVAGLVRARDFRRAVPARRRPGWCCAFRSIVPGPARDGRRERQRRGLRAGQPRLERGARRRGRRADGVHAGGFVARARPAAAARRPTTAASRDGGRSW